VSRRVALTAEETRTIDRGRFVVVDFGEVIEVDGIAIASALVGRVAGGALRAYANVCRHQAVPLDLGTGEPMTDDGRHLFCLRHGALYHPSTGRCVSGPCDGATLFRMVVEETAAGVTVTSELLAAGAP
jgi:nitrite reductase/ring-hydroxylating ferredoxin subunit